MIDRDQAPYRTWDLPAARYPAARRLLGASGKISRDTAILTRYNLS
jgi:hypothetical protein